MVKMNPYLNFPGTTEAAFNFYKSVFGGEFSIIQRFKDTPHGDKLSDTEKEKIMHVSLPVGGSVLMATDALESMQQTMVQGTNFSISIEPDSREEADRIFAGLLEGGKVGMPLEDAFWGAYFGYLTDRYGIQWMVNYTKPNS